VNAIESITLVNVENKEQDEKIDNAHLEEKQSITIPITVEPITITDTSVKSNSTVPISDDNKIEKASQKLEETNNIVPATLKVDIPVNVYSDTTFSTPPQVSLIKGTYI